MAEQFFTAILSYGSPTQAFRLAVDFVRDGFPPEALLVLSNPDGESEGEEAHSPTFRVIRFFRNIGYAAAMNEALLQAHSDGYEFAVLLTQDVQIDRRQAEALVVELRQSVEHAILAPILKDHTGAILSAGGSRARGKIAHLFNSDSSRPSDTAWVDGAALAVRVPIVGEFGFDNRYFLYCEDVDIGFRLRKAGWRVGIAGDVSATEARGAGNRSRAFRYLRTRNLLETFRKDASYLDVAHYLLRLFHRLAVAPRLYPELLGAAHFLFRRFGPPPNHFLKDGDIRHTDCQHLEGIRR